MNKAMREGFVEDDSEPVEPSRAVAADVPAMEEDDLSGDEWPLVVKLMHKPIRKGRDEDLYELTFREPTAMDILRVGGNPCRIEITELAGGRVTYNPVIDDGKMMRLMANLSGLLEPQLQKMDPRDYNSCAHRLRRFFLPEQGIW